MKYIKSAFFACLCSFVIVNSAMADFCNANNPTPAGEYCWATQTYTCESGCYCSGGNEVENGGLLNHCNPSNGTFKFGAISHSSPVAGVHVCPSDYPYSAQGASYSTDCYQICSGGSRLYYARPICYSGKYLPARASSCSDCPAGKYCDIYNGDYVLSSCNDQGITGSCTGNEYSAAGAQVCSTCNGTGKAVVKNGTLNVGCDICVDGTYANDGHTACENCERGYACTGGMRVRCVDNRYTDEENSTTCLECNGDGYAVEVQDGLHINCRICPDGTYADEDHTQCIDCPAGHWCSGGNDKGLCPIGTCAADANGACVPGEGIQCKSCGGANPYSIPARTQCVNCVNHDMYYENGECYDCPSISYNNYLYDPIRIDEQSGTAMCGIKLKNNQSMCNDDTLVQWHVVNNGWKLMDDSVVNADMTHYVKNPLPTSPAGSNEVADFCGACPSNTFNIYTNRTGESACVACPAGYCTSGNLCLKCRAGYYCPGTNGVANSCSGGTVVVDGERYGIEQTEEEEYKCKKGQYSKSGQAECTHCASGYTTNDEASAYVQNVCKKIKVGLNFSGTKKTFEDDYLLQGTINTRVVIENQQ